METFIFESRISKLIFLLLSLSSVLSLVNLIVVKKTTKLDMSRQVFSILANIFIFFGLLNRWIIFGYFPLSNLYESLLFLAWVLLTGSLYFESIIKSKLISATILPIILLIYGFASLVLSPEMQTVSPLPASLNSYWLTYHVSAMILSYGVLIIGSTLCLLFLIMIGYHKMNLNAKYNYSTSIYNLILIHYESLKPSLSDEISKLSKVKLLQNLDNWSYRIIGIGFPFLTIGIIAGGVWANEAWGSYWSWDPKETWALITWIIFAAYLHARITKGWEGKRAAILGSIGFFSIWICYLGVNFLGKGLHSYGWLE